jgi:hypothetical protein
MVYGHGGMPVCRHQLGNFHPDKFNRTNRTWLWLIFSKWVNSSFLSPKTLTIYIGSQALTRKYLPSFTAMENLFVA